MEIIIILLIIVLIVISISRSATKQKRDEEIRRRNKNNITMRYVSKSNADHAINQVPREIDLLNQSLSLVEGP